MTKKKVPGTVDKNATKKALPDLEMDGAALTENTANAIADNTAINKESNHAGITTPAAPLTTSQNTATSTLSFVGPTTDSLKEKFSAQKIPLQIDFANLIDVADCGRNAVGLNPDQPGETGAGLQLDSESRLAVLPQSGGGISVNAAGVGVSLEANKGLGVSASGLAITPGNGINLSATGVGVTANTGRAIIVDSGGVGINYGSTLQVTNQQLGVSDNLLQRKTMTGTMQHHDEAEPFFKIMSIPSGMKNAYAQVYITSSFDGQKFVFTICCDGGVGTSGGTYSMSISNCYIKDFTYSIPTLHLYHESNNDMSVCAHYNNPQASTTVSMNYSPCDVQGIELYPFIRLTAMPSVVAAAIHVNSNNSIQGD